MTSPAVLLILIRNPSFPLLFFTGISNTHEKSLCSREKLSNNRIQMAFKEGKTSQFIYFTNRLWTI